MDAISGVGRIPPRERRQSRRRPEWKKANHLPPSPAQAGAPPAAPGPQDLQDELTRASLLNQHLEGLLRRLELSSAAVDPASTSAEPRPGPASNDPKAGRQDPTLLCQLAKRPPHLFRLHWWWPTLLGFLHSEALKPPVCRGARRWPGGILNAIWNIHHQSTGHPPTIGPRQKTACRNSRILESSQSKFKVSPKEKKRESVPSLLT